MTIFWKILSFSGINFEKDQYKVGKVHLKSILSSKTVIDRRSRRSSLDQLRTRNSELLNIKPDIHPFYSRAVPDIILTNY